MVPISLVELHLESKPIMPDFKSSFGLPLGTIGFVSYVQPKHQEYQIEATQVTEAFETGKYYLRNKFTIIYLYDHLNDIESKNFMALYGGKLHNQSSFNVSILTFFSDDMVNNWKNVQFRDFIPMGNKQISRDARQIVNDFQVSYHISKLPAMIIVKNDDGKEESCVINLCGYGASDLYKIFSEVINQINDNCEEDFSVLTEKICGPNSITKKGNNIGAISTFNLIADLAKKKKNYSLEYLAIDLGMDVKTLYNKRVKDKFSRDELFSVAIIFGLDIQDLNNLLRMNNQQEIGFAEKDNIIRMCLFNHCDLYKTNEKLREQGFPPINNIKEY